MPFSDLTPESRLQLLTLARASIEQSLPSGAPVPFEHRIDDPALREPRASFVTLRDRPRHLLRGCCGTLEARFALAEDVWRNAWASAFADPRFPPLTQEEWPQLELHVSVLSTPVAFEVSSESELFEALRPSIDGLVLEYGAHRATFLPAVWEELRDPKEFVRHLRAKAGLPPNFWSSQIKWSRYGVVDIDEGV
jgi:uncharacterized protein